MKKSSKRVATQNAKKKNIMSDVDFYIKFKNDSDFSGKEYVKTIESDNFVELYEKLQRGAAKLYKKNTGMELEDDYEELIAWDLIVESVGGRVINGYDAPEKATLWGVCFSGWCDYYQLDDKYIFKELFDYSLKEARKKKEFIF
jgi:hypothetical protein